MSDEDRFYDANDDVDRQVRIDVVDAPASEFEEPRAKGVPGDKGDKSVPRSFDPSGNLSAGESELFEKLVKERDDYLDALRRLQAEFENFRKRTIRQQTEHLDRASLSLVERLLPVLDALDLALAHTQIQNGSADESDAAAALVQIAGLARSTLEKEGLERIDEIGVRFDPTIHDAVSRVETEGSSSHEPVVDEVMRSGYRLKGKVIRPAMVSVKD